MNIKLVFAFFTACSMFSGASFSAESIEAYKLNQGDVLQISVWGEESLQKEVRVLPDGSITFPLAGRVEVANATTPEIEKRITEKLEQAVKNAKTNFVFISSSVTKTII